MRFVDLASLQCLRSLGQRSRRSGARGHWPGWSDWIGQGVRRVMPAEVADRGLWQTFETAVSTFKVPMIDCGDAVWVLALN